MSYEYGNLRAPGWTAIEGPSFGRVTRAFSSTGKVTSWREPTGDTFTRLYNAAGAVDEEIDPLGNSTIYAYVLRADLMSYAATEMRSYGIRVMAALWS